MSQFPVTDGLNAYLERIGLSGPVPVTEEGLARVHQAHSETIPFENLNILLGRGISLRPEDVFAKLVTQRRGGYCFEQNGLFLAALTALGFTVRPLLARVWVGNITEPREKTHQLLLVRLGGREWIADVGFGTAGPALPLPFEHDRISEQPGRRYRLRADEVFGHMLERSVAGGDWEKLYSFTLERCWQADFEMGNHYVSTHPKSPFTTRVVCSIQTPDGWRVLVNHDLTEVADGQMQCSIAEPGAAYMDMLRDRFRLDPGVPYEALFQGEAAPQALNAGA